MITSKANPQLKKIRQLIDSAKARDEMGSFVIEGERLVADAPSTSIQGLYVSENYEGKIPKGIQAEVIVEGLFKSACDTVNPQGILAIVKKPEHAMNDLLGRNLYVILDDIRDPGNLGTIIRTAEAAGAAVIMSPSCVDIFNSKVIRATMGTIFRVPWIICDTLEAILRLQEDGVTVCAAALDGSVPYTEVNAKRCAYIIGNEANGVSENAQKAADIKVRIPMQGQVESLNAAISAAILMYHEVK